MMAEEVTVNSEDVARIEGWLREIYEIASVPFKLTGKMATITAISNQALTLLDARKTGSRTCGLCGARVPGDVCCPRCGGEVFIP